MNKLFGIKQERIDELWKTVDKIESDLRDADDDGDYGTKYLNRLIDVYNTKFWTIEELVLMTFAIGKHMGLTNTE